MNLQSFKQQKAKKLALAFSKPDFGKPLWGPHPTKHQFAVCLREHELEDGTKRFRGDTINFLMPHLRDAWLAAQHPKAWGKLLARWAKGTKAS